MSVSGAGAACQRTQGRRRSAARDGAKVVALANAGGDASTSIKQAHEFGLTRGGQKLAALFLNITDVHALGLDTAQGLVVTTSFYWDRTDTSRAFGKRFLERAKNAPTFLQAGAYSAVTHYLKAVKEAGTDATGPVAAQMKKTKINDPMTENGWIREDGRVMRDFYVVQVKAPAESKAPWDYYKVIGKIAAEDAALPRSALFCTADRSLRLWAACWKSRHSSFFSPVVRLARRGL